MEENVENLDPQSEHEELDDLETIRERNFQERNAFLASLKGTEFDNAIDAINALLKPPPETRKIKTIRQKSDPGFRFFGRVPLERRSSNRLKNRKPDFTYQDLPDDKIGAKFRSDSNNYEDLEEIVYDVNPNKKRRLSSSKSLPPARVLPVEEVTEENLAKIQTKGNKVYSADGSSCHQCRQKTVDMKTVCRSGFCFGVRGQFCGICVINRYGEDPIAALKDPKWTCYVCRGVCNCSFCRAKMGKRPTGILFPLAVKNGFKSVHAFLQHLNGYGDYANRESEEEDLLEVLGFEDNHAVCKDQTRIDLNCHNCTNNVEHINLPFLKR